MGTIAEKLALLLSTKSRIRNAIISKIGQFFPEDVPFAEYPSLIDSICTSSSLQPTRIKDGTIDIYGQGLGSIDVDVSDFNANDNGTVTIHLSVSANGSANGNFNANGYVTLELVPQS